MLIVASMVQAEAQTAHDMPLVASVIYNRLKAGMMLQFDSTTRYAVDNYTRPLTVSQLKSPSPWNTHTHTGLPPTPINNPDLAAIKAAASAPHDQLPLLRLQAVQRFAGLREQLLASSSPTWPPSTPPRARTGSAPKKRCK